MSEAWQLAVDIAIVTLVPVAGYIALQAKRVYKRIYQKQQQHDRIIFGESSVEEWDGLLGISYSTKHRQDILIDNQNEMIDALAAADMVEPQRIQRVQQSQTRPDGGEGKIQAN